MFVIYDAPNPILEQAEAGDFGQVPQVVRGYLAYWGDGESQSAYVYSRVLFGLRDAAKALVDLQRDLDLDVASWGEENRDADRLLSLPVNPADDFGRWVPATFERLYAITGLEPESDPDSVVAGDDTSPGGSLDCYEIPSIAAGSRVIYPSAPPEGTLEEELLVFGLGEAGCCDPTSCVFHGCDDDICTKDRCPCSTCTHRKLTCDDSNPCTADSCVNDPAIVCVNVLKFCDDGKTCTADYCEGGNCQFPSTNCSTTAL